MSRLKCIVKDSGMSNATASLVFLNTHFLSIVQSGSKDHTVLLIFDGHASHTNVPVLEWRAENHVELQVRIKRGGGKGSGPPL